MDLEKIENELLEWAARYGEWSKPINESFQGVWNKVFKDGYMLEDARRDTQAFRDQRRIEWDPDPEVEPLLDQMCQGYLIATPEERARSRSVVGMLGDVSDYMGSFVYVCARHIHGVGDVEWLRKGLAAVSIQNGGKDLRDVMLAVAEICVKAEGVGIDPVPHFQDVAQMSIGETPTHGDTSISGILADFQDYAVLKERRSRKPESE